MSIQENLSNEQRTMIVYYSLEGNTEYVASRISEICSFDMLRLVPVKKYPDKGFRKFFWGGKSAVMAETPELEPYEFQSEKYDRIIIGFPVWAGNVTPPIRTFIRDNDLREKKIAVYACESGAGAEKAFDKLKAALKIDRFEAELILIDPKAKPNTANEEKIRNFCALLTQQQ